MFDGRKEHTLDDCLSFGKYKDSGMELHQIIEKDAKYVEFLCDEVNLLLDDEAWEDLQNKLEKAR